MSDLFKFANVNLTDDCVRCTNQKADGIVSGEIALREEARAEKLLAKAAKEAEKIISDARTKADKIKRLALDEAETIKKRAADIGYGEGHKEASQQVQAENDDALADLKALMGRLDREKERLFEENRQAVIDMALKIAEKVLNQRLNEDEDTFIKLYEQAVKDLSAQRWLKVSVAKSEAEIATRNSAYLLELVSGAKTIDIEVVDEAPAGYCVVETSEKIVDAGILTQLGTLREAFANA